MRPSRQMTREFQKRIVAWVRANLTRLGWSQAELSRRLNMKDPSYVNHSMRGARDFKAHEISAMERLFGNSHKSNINQNFSVERFHKSAQTTALGEIITAGFREGAAMALSTQSIEIPALNLPNYGDIEQEVWRVEGDCADLYVQSGNFVIAVDYKKVRPELRVGDKVVVRRYHPIRFQRGDLTHYENSIRQIVEDEQGRKILKSLSSHPDVRDFVYDPDDKSTVIHRLIIGGQFHESY